MYKCWVYRQTVSTEGSRVSYLKAYPCLPQIEHSYVLGNSLFQLNKSNLNRTFTFVCLIEAENYFDFKESLKEISFREKAPIEFIENDKVKLFNGNEFVLRGIKKSDFF